MGFDVSIIPVVMFHSVGLDRTGWIFHQLSEPLELFEEKLCKLKDAGYRFIFWDELYEHMASKKILHHPAVMVTFDDGYLDNWVYAFPLLRKYGIKATIFVNPEFVDPAAEPRPAQYVGRHIPPEEAMGFLSWEEMRRMVASGLIDIQSHAMTHTWHFSGSEIIDFYKPGKKYPWLGWNLNPKLKHKYMTYTPPDYVPLGYPVFRYQKALEGRRFFPDSKLINRLVDFAACQDEAFWTQNNWREMLQLKSWQIMDQLPSIGSYETEADYRNRVTWELSESRRLISEHLNKQVNYICWPGGGYNNVVLKIAKALGYKSWTLASRDRSGNRNVPGVDPSNVKRIGAFTHRYARGRYIGRGSADYFFHRLRAHQNDTCSKWRLKLSQAINLAGKLKL